MSYTPTTWTNGDTITAAKLNKMEQGIADAGGGGLGVDVLVYINGSDLATATAIGDYATVLAKLDNDEPVIGFVLSYNKTSVNITMHTLTPLYYIGYENDDPVIILAMDSVQGWHWTENGLTYYND